jgi:F-type H+-transporting ATPase subunit b
MELSWSTFALEIVNFIILVWILKRFLYKPVLDTIARRRAGIQKTLDDARAMQDGAEALSAKYENRLEAWECEQREARQALTRELDEQRERRLQELETELERVRREAALADAHRQETLTRELERSAIEESARFAARFLERLAGPEVNQRLVDLVIDELSEAPAEALGALSDVGAPSSAPIRVTSAYPLADRQCQRLQHALSAALRRELQLEFEQDEKLVAGLRITVGGWTLGLNIQDELRGLVDLAHGA